MTLFKTLVLREWMQHGRGWWILAATPLIVLLISLAVGGVRVDGPDSATSVALVIGGGYPLALIFLVWLVIGIQASGLGRRDQQDRSIEFWRSLPVSDVQSVAATTLTHLVLLPLGITAIGVACGLLVGPLVSLRLFGVHEFAQLPWSSLLTLTAAGGARLLLGSLLASLWVAPLLLLGMAASAWLKRWGLPVVVLVLAGGSAILKKVYDLPWLARTLSAWGQNFLAALVPGSRHGGIDLEDAGMSVAHLPTLLWNDGLQALGDLASPEFAVALLTGAAAFALLVWRRRSA